MNAVTTLQSIIEGAAREVGPAVVGLGRGWGLGSGVVIAQGRVLTSAHNLRRDEVTVVFADERREQATVAGTDPDLDLAVLEVDTGDAPAVRWEPGDAPRHRHARGGAGQSRRPRSAGHARLRVVRGPQLPGPARTPGPGRHRAHGPSAARLVGRSAGRFRGTASGPQRAASGRRAHPGRAGRRPGAGARAPARERRGAAPTTGSAWPWRRRGPRGACDVRSACPSGTACWSARSPRTARPTAPGIERGDLIVAAGDTEIDGVESLYAALDGVPADGGSLRLTVVRGTDERSADVDFAISGEPAA